MSILTAMRLTSCETPLLLFNIRCGCHCVLRVLPRGVTTALGLHVHELRDKRQE